MKATPNLSVDEARLIIAALGGQAAVARAFHISRRTVKRFITDGSGGTNAAALRLAYWAWGLGVAVDWRRIVLTPVEDFPAERLRKVAS